MKISTRLLTIIVLLFAVNTIKSQVALYGGPISPCTGSLISFQVGLYVPVPTAVSYTWTVVGPTQTTQTTYTPATPTGSIINFSTSPGIYTVTVYPYSSGNILITGAIASNTYNVGAPVSVSVSSLSPANGCVGTPIVLYAFGAASYTWSNGSTGYSISVMPMSNTCFSVLGMCSNVPASQCVTVIPVTFASLAASSSVVCLGSSVLLTASGAASYTWSNGPTTNTISVTPTTSTMYSVNSTNANGCVSTSTMAVFISTLCSDVWPGDADSDGLVGTSDVFEIGIQFGSTGAARTPGGNTYVSQYATNWVGTGSNGKNIVHADCNGDGVVNISDTVAISNNFGIPHAFKPNPSAGNDIRLVNNQAALYSGIWNTLDIVLGDASSAPIQLYGISFDLDFESSKIDPNSISVNFSPSFIKSNNSTIDFTKLFFGNGKVSSVCVRTNQTQVSGKGKIGEVKFKVASTVNETQTLNFGLSNVVITSNTGVKSNLTGTTSTLPVSKNLVGIQTQFKPLQFTMYPNPSNEIITFAISDNEICTYSITDITGRLICEGSVKNNQVLDVSTFSAGVYLVTLENKNTRTQNKLVVEH
jgi:hypothetical protein